MTHVDYPLEQGGNTLKEFANAILVLYGVEDIHPGVHPALDTRITQSPFTWEQVMDELERQTNPPRGDTGGMGVFQSIAFPLTPGTVIEVLHPDMDGLTGRDNHPQPYHKGWLGKIVKASDWLWVSSDHADIEGGAWDFRPDNIRKDMEQHPDDYAILYEVDMGVRFDLEGETEQKPLMLTLADYEFRVI